MPTEIPRPLLEISYHESEQAYLRSLPPEHFMESESQSTQRAITVASLTLVAARRPNFHLYSEMLIQYPRKGNQKRGQVVPDNMVVVHDGPLHAGGSFNLPLQPAAPFWVLEYVSKWNKRKDYDDNMRKYERELKVPYYLLFYPETQDFTLYRHNKRKYVSVKPDKQERYALEELELEMTLQDGWVRYWYRGKLLLLPDELQNKVDDQGRQLEMERTARETAEMAQRAAEMAQQAAEMAQQAAELAAQVAERRSAEEHAARQAADARAAGMEQEVERMRAEMEQLKQRRNYK
jgi:Uma2 family endonuclease